MPAMLTFPLATSLLTPPLTYRTLSMLDTSFVTIISCGRHPWTNQIWEVRQT